MGAQGGVDVGIAAPTRTVPGHDDEVETRQQLPMMPETLTCKPLDPVPVDGTPYTALGDGEAEPGGATPVVTRQHGETAVAGANGAVEHVLEVRPGEQAQGAREIEFGPGGVGRGRVHTLRR